MPVIEESNNLITEPLNFSEELLGTSKNKIGKKGRKKIAFIISIIILTIMLLGGISIFLYKNVPNENSFELWVKSNVDLGPKKTTSNKKKGASAAIQIQILATYRFSNHTLYSKATASLNGEKIKFIGVANNWYTIK